MCDWCVVIWGLDPFKNEKSSENLERFMCGAFFGVLGNQNPKMLVCDVRVLKEEQVVLFGSQIVTILKCQCSWGSALDFLVNAT